MAPCRFLETAALDMTVKINRALEMFTCERLDCRLTTQACAKRRVVAMRVENQVQKRVEAEEQIGRGRNLMSLKMSFTTVKTFAHGDGLAAHPVVVACRRCEVGDANVKAMLSD